MSNIKDEINSLEDAVESNDISKLFNIKFNVEQYSQLPPKIVLTLPRFAPQRIQGENVDLFGNLSSSSITSDEHGYSMKTIQKSPEAGSSPPVKQLLDEPEIVTIIDAKYKYYIDNVACLNEEEIWTSGDISVMKLFSINQGSILKSITTKSSFSQAHIAVNQSGGLLYTDHRDRTVNIVKNKDIEEVIRLENWRINGVCSSFSGDLLVIMYSDDDNQSKLVRYSKSTEKQSIQFDDDGKPLYSCGPSNKDINENKNLDITVADWGAKRVVVVNKAGKLRFMYTGNTPAPKNKPFFPRGITTDSQSHILTIDYYNDCIHIIDQDGVFLRYLNCRLIDPHGLCTDTNDNLFIAECRNKQVKKIKYQK
ncbi:uncharacterized protein LOC134280328 [Saccostrea cucullata]|uniref:uncharacterized protein LOC134280328 n=1 Tax=Saccostrea cuccullata TaxID=36930 RepID=UPI002ED5FF10